MARKWRLSTFLTTAVVGSAVALSAVRAQEAVPQASEPADSILASGQPSGDSASTDQANQNAGESQPSQSQPSQSQPRDDSRSQNNAESNRRDTTSPNEQDARGNRQTTPRGGREQAGGSDQGDDRGDAFLGVGLAPSSGGGVLVPDVAPDGPAEQAGIRGGDYLLSINGTRVSSPQQVARLISQMRPSDRVTIRTWRNGREREVIAQLSGQRMMGFRPDNGFAPPRDDGQANQSGPWLGIMLSDEREQGQDQGLMIERVHPQGPASQAGLQEGDILVSINGREVAGNDDDQAAFESLETGKETQVVILRNGQRETIMVTPGDRGQLQTDDEMDGSFESQYGSDDVPEHFMLLEQHRHMARQHERIEELCSQLLQEVQDLRKEVDSLKATSDNRQD